MGIFILLATCVIIPTKQSYCRSVQILDKGCEYRIPFETHDDIWLQLMMIHGVCTLTEK